MEIDPSPPFGNQPVYPVEYNEEIELRDGTPVFLRPIRPEDAPRLQFSFLRLSDRSIYLRFLGPMNALSDTQAREFSSLDYRVKMAFVAVTNLPCGNTVIGVARYGMVEPRVEGLAELAIVVGDEFQGRGLGRIMLRQISKYALAHGVLAFLATVHHSNAQVLRFIQRSCLPYTKRTIEPGVWEVRIRLEPLLKKA